MDVSTDNGKTFLSKTPTIVFTCVQIFLGVDYGVAKIVTKKWGYFLKVLCLLFSLNVTVIALRPVETDGYFIIYNVSLAFEYMSYTLIILLSQYTLYEYLVEFDGFESYDRSANRKIFTEVFARVLILTLISLVVKVVVAVIYCTFYGDEIYCTLSVVEYLKQFLSHLAFDAMVLVQYLVMYTYYRRLHMLKLKVTNNEITPTKVLRSYKSILDAVDRIKSILDKLVICGLLYSIPRYMTLEYKALHQLKINQDWLCLAVQYVVVIQMGFMTALAPITADMANSQADTIALALHNHLIGATGEVHAANDQQRHWEIKSALYYMAGRPSQYYVWRRIPLDLRLPVTVVSMMTTYLIVIVQFTHLYD